MTAKDLIRLTIYNCHSERLKGSEESQHITELDSSLLSE